MIEPTIEDYERRIGELSHQALNISEITLDDVTAALGVATRHLERVRTGVLPLTPGLRIEIERSFDRARAIVGPWDQKRVEELQQLRAEITSLTHELTEARMSYETLRAARKQAQIYLTNNGWGDSSGPTYMRRIADLLDNAITKRENESCPLCSIDDGLVQEWVSKAREVAKVKGLLS